MTYAVKEIFYTLQGEGINAGRPAVFCRFSGCNLWNGLEAARSSAICRFCDTDFWGVDGPGGGLFPDAESLACAVGDKWPVDHAQDLTKFVVCTGGEPLLQLDEALITALHQHGFEIALETNGTLPAPPDIDWICVSPKASTTLRLTKGHELKVVYPQTNADPDRYESLDFKYFLLQPMDGPDRERNTALAIDYCKQHQRWRLSLQTHKLIGIP